MTRKDEEDRRLHSVALQNAESIRIARRRGEQHTEITLWEQANLLNLTHDSIFVRNIDGAIRYWNRAAEELYGWTSEEAVGRRAHELLKTVFPTPLGQIEEEVSRAGRWEGELVHTKKDGSQVVVASRWSLQRDERGAPIAILVTNNDITERKRVKEGLCRSEKLIHAFWENSPNLIFLKDTECRYLFVNKKFEEALHVRQEEIQGLRDDEIFPSEQAAAFQANDREVLQALVPMEFEEAALQEDGPHISIVQKFPLFDAEGKAYAIGGVVTDITERKRTEAELLVLKNELAEELMAMTRLHGFSTRLLATTELLPVLDEVLHATIAMQNADFGNIQIYNPETKALEIVAHRGFQQDFLDHFRSVHDAGAACGRALQLGKRVVIEDVQTDPDYQPHREIAAAAGFRAVQSTPLFSRSGEFLGMVSTHFRAPHRPSERDLRLTDLYVRHAAEVIERKRAEAARRQTEEQYRNVVDTATDAVVSIDETGHIVFANPATTKVFGYASSELIGQPLTMLMPQHMGKLHQAGLRRYVTSGQRHINWQGAERVGLRKNGEEFPVEVSIGEIIKNGHRAFTGFIRDISERKQAEELRTAQSRQAALRAEISTAFATGDNVRAVLQGCADALVRQVEAALARIWTLNKQENVLELQASAGMYTHLDGAHSRVPVGKLKIGLIAQERKPHLTNDVVNDPRISDKVWAKSEGMVAFAGYPLVVEDRVVGVMALFSRTTLTAATLDTLASIADSVAQGIERKRAEEERERLRLLEADLAHINRVSMMGELAASLAHEIKQPITAAMADAKTGLRWLAREMPDLQEAREAMMRVVKDAARAAEIINHLRSFYKKDTPMERELVDVNEVAHEIIGLLYSEANRYSISMRAELAAELPKTKADRVQLQQVFMNLMLNGIEAMKDTAGELAIKSCQTVDGQVLISVSDTGVGLPGEKLDEIFSAFFTTKPQGTGMGLAITRSIVESHGGRLWATANPERGATFHFTLPTETRRLCRQLEHD